jgi:hypothetical protein
LRNRLTDMDTRLKEMDQAAIDVSVLRGDARITTQYKS